MSRVVPYSQLLHAAEAAGLRCVYPNGAAFGPVSDDWHVAGWLAGEDATVRPAFRDRVRTAPAGISRLAFAPWLTTAWQDALAGPSEAWLAPVHHWAAALDHGDDRAGMDEVLRRLHADPTALAGRRQADAIVISSADDLAGALPGLFDAMGKNDFALLFPPLRVTATLHHHRQIWWRCEDAAIADALLAMP